MTERITDEPERVLEGTWEDVVQRAAELKGRRVKILVYSQDKETEGTDTPNGPRNLLEALGDYVGAGSSGGGEPLSEDTGKRFTDYLVQKRHEGRL